MSRRRDTRYAHAFSRGRVVAMVSEGSWRIGVGPRAPCRVQTQCLGAPAKPPGRGGEKSAFDERSGNPTAPILEQGSKGAKPALSQRSGSATNALNQQGGGAQNALKQRSGSAKTMTLYPMSLDPRRWKALRVSPTIANLYKSSAGVAVICADCLHGAGHGNPVLPDHFRRQWHLTLLEIEKKCRCETCGSRNARVYPWWGEGSGEIGAQGYAEAER